MPIPEKTLERLKPYFIALFLTFIVIGGIMAQSTGDYGGGSTQPSPGLKFVGAGTTTIGVTGNVVTVSSSGGGSAAAAVTNAPNLFTTSSQNTFNSWTTFAGSVTNTSTFVMPNVLSFDPVGSRFIYHQNGQPFLDFNQDFGDTGIYWTNGNRVITIDFSVPKMEFANTGGTVMWKMDGSGSDSKFRSSGGAEIIHLDGRYLAYGNGQHSLDWYSGVPGGVLHGTWTNRGDLVVLTNFTSRGTSTFGTTSADTVVFTGANATIANGLNVGSNILNIPSSAGTVITNQATATGGFFSSGTITASNIVAQTTDGTTYYNSGTNQLIRIICNSSTGIIQTEGIFTSRTNALTGTHTINTIYTNNSMRATVSTGILLPTALTTVSAASFWTISGGTTNWGPLVMSYAGVNGAVTNSCGGTVDPGAFYMWSNVTTTAGTPSTVPAYSIEKRH